MVIHYSLLDVFISASPQRIVCCCFPSVHGIASVVVLSLQRSFILTDYGLPCMDILSEMLLFIIKGYLHGANKHHMDSNLLYFTAYERDKHSKCLAYVPSDIADSSPTFLRARCDVDLALSWLYRSLMLWWMRFLYQKVNPPTDCQHHLCRHSHRLRRLHTLYLSLQEKSVVSAVGDTR
jgi:hypothetical protein